MKKGFVLFLTMALLISMLAGCGAPKPESGSTGNSSSSGAVKSSSDEGKAAAHPSTWPTVSFPAVPTVEVTDEAMVEEALNNYLVSINAGVKADIVNIDFGNLSTVMTLMLSSTEDPIDLFSYAFFSNLSSVVTNEQVIALDDYISQYPDIVKAVGEENMKLGKINGTQYAVPVVGSYATAWYYVLRRDIAEEIGVSDQDGKQITIEELTAILTDAKAAHPDLVYLPIAEDIISLYNFDSLGDADIMGALENFGADSTEIINIY